MPITPMNGVSLATPYQPTYSTPLRSGLTQQAPRLNYGVLNERLGTARQAANQRFLLNDLQQAQQRLGLTPQSPTLRPQTPTPTTPTVGGAIGAGAGGALIGAGAAALTGGDVARGAVTGGLGSAGYVVGAGVTAAALVGAGVTAPVWVTGAAAVAGGLLVGAVAAGVAGSVYDQIARQLGWKTPGDKDNFSGPVVQLATAGTPVQGQLGKAGATYILSGSGTFKLTSVVDQSVSYVTKNFSNVQTVGPLSSVYSNGPDQARVYMYINSASTPSGIPLCSEFITNLAIKQLTSWTLNIVRADGTPAETDRQADPNYAPATPAAPKIQPTNPGGATNTSGGTGPTPTPPGLAPTPKPTPTPTGTGPTPQAPTPVIPSPPGTDPAPATPTPQPGPTPGPAGQPGTTPGTPAPIPGQPTSGPGNRPPTPTTPTPTTTETTTKTVDGDTYIITTSTTNSTTTNTVTNNFQQVNNSTTKYEQNDQRTIINQIIQQPQTPTTAQPPQPDDRLDRILANTNTTLTNQATIITRITTLVADTVTAINPLINGATALISGWITDAWGLINNHTTNEVNRIRGEINNHTTSTVNAATTAINSNTDTKINAATTAINSNTDTKINNATTVINNNTTTTVTQNPTDLSGIQGQLQSIVTLSQDVKEDTTSTIAIIGTLGTTAFLTAQFAQTNTKIDNIPTSPCVWPADRNTVINNGNTANTTLGTITNTQLVSLDAKTTAVDGKVSAVDSKVTVVDEKIGVPGTINQASLFGLIGLPGGVNTATIWGFMEKSYRSLYLDRVYNALSILLQIHNAAMLSRNLAESIGQLINSTMTALKLKDEKDEELNIPEILGKGITDFLKGLVGEEIFNGLSRAWKLSSAIYTAAVNTFERLLSVLGGIAEGLEILSKYTGKIGNALKKSGTVLENSYQWLDENIRIKVGKLAPLDSFVEGTQNLTEVAEIVQETQEAYNETQTELNEIRTKLNERVQQKTDIEDSRKDASKSPAIDKSDLIKPGG